jgi:hypothetical protein
VLARGRNWDAIRKDVEVGRSIYSTRKEMRLAVLLFIDLDIEGQC